MILSIEHILLVSGPDLLTCSEHVKWFFKKSQLVRYDSITVDQENSVQGTDPLFEELLELSIARNRETLGELLAKLQNEGCSEMHDLLTLPQGFPSKILHTMCHLLDGFFGVDSYFFDIDEDSNWLTENRKQLVKESPETCWLIRIHAKSFYGGGFEKKKS